MLIADSWMESMAEQQHLPPNVQMYKCPTNISHQTRFSFSKIFRKASQKTNFLLFFLSQSPFHGCYYHYLTKFFFPRYPNLHEVRLIPTKRDIAFVEFLDEGSAGVAKDALHNYKLDGENKIKVRTIGQIHFFRAHFLNPLISRLRSQGSSYGCTFVSHFVVSPIIYNIQQSSTFAVVNLMTGTYWSIVQYHPA